MFVTRMEGLIPASQIYHDMEVKSLSILTITVVLVSNVLGISGEHVWTGDRIMYLA